MPLEPGVPEGPALTLDEAIAALEGRGFDVRDADSLDHAVGVLAGLARNRDFLGDLALDEMRRRFAGQARDNGYSAQVLMLCAPRPDYVLRANIWPSEAEAVMRASGPHAFFYGLPHDHDFDFLTIGYAGPGYRSDYYEYDGTAVAGLIGEDAGLRFVETSCLAEGRMLLYRAGRDVHCQFPPERLSVSLNILQRDEARRWQDQYRFDCEAGRITGLLSHHPNMLVARLAMLVCPEEGRDLLHGFAHRHSCARMRWTCIEALGEAITDAAARHDWFDGWTGAEHRLVRELSRSRVMRLSGNGD